jgi:hypothetical protein
MSALDVLRGPLGRQLSIRSRPNRHDDDKVTTNGENVEEDNMRYCLLMHYQEGGEIGLTEEDMAPAMAAFQAYADDLSAAGVLIGTEVLDSVVSTTTVTGRNGTAEIQDGPFADTKEKLGGLFVIEVDNLDDAIKWAQRNPANGWGSIEIRPVARTYAANRGWYNP